MTMSFFVAKIGRMIHFSFREKSWRAYMLFFMICFKCIGSSNSGASTGIYMPVLILGALLGLGLKWAA
jgi:H+/Cl- antiporter ClcA